MVLGGGVETVATLFFLNTERASKDPDAALIMSGGLTAYNEDLQKI
jgi:hypothetical protein